MTIRRLTCCVCGADAGRWQQWHNRDTGFGICRRCVEWVASDTREAHQMNAGEIERMYGREGVHYAGRIP